MHHCSWQQRQRQRQWQWQRQQQGQRQRQQVVLVTGRSELERYSPLLDLVQRLLPEGCAVSGLVCLPGGASSATGVLFSLAHDPSLTGACLALLWCCWHACMI
jgi:hypothetical protein